MGIIEESESDIIKNMVKFKDVKIRNIMTPFSVMKIASEDNSIKDFYNKKDPKELSNIIANKLSIGNDEASSYIPILGKDGITGVLSDLGYEKKEITKLIKTI